MQVVISLKIELDAAARLNHLLYRLVTHRLVGEYPQRTVTTWLPPGRRRPG